MTSAEYQAQYGRGQSTQAAPATPYEDPAVSAGEIADYLYSQSIKPMDYLNWQQLKDRLNSVTDPRLLAEPVLFTLLDPYGNEQVMPVQLLIDTWHPDDTPNTVHWNEDEFEFSRFVPDEFTEDNERPLRQLPHGALVLHYSEMDEDGDEQVAFLSQPNPHTPPPTPGPAPLFE